jgi:FkbM family methyltransferase
VIPKRANGLRGRARIAVLKLRELIYDSLPRGYDFRCTTSNGVFVLNTADRFISRYTFLHRRPFDYDKFEKAVELTGRLIGVSTFDVLIDVGANVGSISIPAVADGKVSRALAFEPEPENFRRLRSSIELNGLSAKIDARALALGDRDGREVELELSADNFGDHRVGRGRSGDDLEDKPRPTIKVQQRTIDSVLARETCGSLLIWIDSQGYEGHVLTGARETLRKRPPVVVEFWPSALARVNGYERLWSALRDSPHRHFMDLRRENPVEEPLTRANLDALFAGLRGDDGFTDILIV